MIWGYHYFWKHPYGSSHFRCIQNNQLMEVDSASDFTIQTFQEKLAFFLGGKVIFKKKVVHGSNSQFLIDIGKRNPTDSTESSSFNSISSNRYTKTLSPKDLFFFIMLRKWKHLRVSVVHPHRNSQGLRLLYDIGMAKNGSTRTNEHSASLLAMEAVQTSKLWSLHHPVLPQSCECT